MDRPYDDAEGIKEYLKDMEGLNRLIRERQKVGYAEVTRCSLHEFVIMGRWATDTCGNFGDMTMLDGRHRALSAEATEAIIASLPPVMTKQEFFLALKPHGVESISVSGTRCSVAPARVQCRECGERWTVANAHDAIVTTGSPEIDMAAFIGKTFRNLDDSLRTRTDAKCFIDGEIPLKHERFVDMTPHPTIPDFYENKDGWVKLGHWNEERRARDPAGFVKLMEKVGQPEFTEPGKYDPWQYVFQEGDRTYGHAIYYTHRKCFHLKKSRESRDYYVGIFKDAGFPDPVTREVPNERCDQECCMPWQIGQFPFGDIKVGWRSSVVSIDWSGLRGSPDLSSLFEDVHSTKWKHGVHANTRELAVEYLSRIRTVLDAGLRCEHHHIAGGPECPNFPSQFLIGDVKGSRTAVSVCERHKMPQFGDGMTVMEFIVAKVHGT